MTAQEKVDTAIRFLLDNGSVDGTHHKMWTIDQTLRILIGDPEIYEQIIHDECFCDPEHPNDEIYSWDTGIAP